MLVMGRDAACQSPDAFIVIRGEQLEIVSQSKYLGSVYTSDGVLDAKIAHRVASANSAYAGH